MRYVELNEGWEDPRVKIRRDEDDRTKFYISYWDRNEERMDYIWNRQKQTLVDVGASPDAEILYDTLEAARADYEAVCREVEDMGI